MNLYKIMFLADNLPLYPEPRRISDIDPITDGEFGDS